MRTTTQVAAALRGADYVAADPHMRDYRHSAMRMDVFVLGKQAELLCSQRRVPASPGCAAALACARNLDQFWSVYDVRHRVLRGHLLALAAEVRRLDAIRVAQPV